MKKLIILMLVISYAGILSGQTSADFVLRANLIDSGKSDEAINTLTQAMQTFNESSLYLLNDLYAERGCPQAISSLNSANKLQPSSGEYGLQGFTR
jgi:hypothetical protein